MFCSLRELKKSRIVQVYKIFFGLKRVIRKIVICFWLDFADLYQILLTMFCVYLSDVARISQWGWRLAGVWGRSLQPPEAIGFEGEAHQRPSGLGAKPPARLSAGRFLQFLNKNNTFFCIYLLFRPNLK